MFIYIRCIAFYTPLTSSSFFSMLFFVVSYKNHDSILVVYWKTNIQTVPKLLEHLGFALCYFWFFFLSRFVFFDSVILAFSMECYEFFCLIDCFRFFSFFVSFLKTFSEPFKILWLMKWWLHYGTQRTLTSIIWYCDNMWHFQNNSLCLPVLLFDTYCDYCDYMWHSQNTFWYLPGIWYCASTASLWNQNHRSHTFSISLLPVNLSLKSRVPT